MLSQLDKYATILFQDFQRPHRASLMALFQYYVLLDRVVGLFSLIQ